jgi:hypothetical protein
LTHCALNALILEYTLFIRKNAAFVFFRAQQRQEALTEAMLAFVHAVQTYNEADGVFINYERGVFMSAVYRTVPAERGGQTGTALADTESCDSADA